MTTDAFGNPIPDGLNQPNPIASPPTPAPLPPTGSSAAPPPKSKPPLTSKSAPPKTGANPGAKGKPQQSKFDSLKDNTQRVVKEGLEQGLGDEIAGMLKTILHNILMTPYDIMNFSLVSFILLSPAGKKKFLSIVIFVSLGLALPWMYLFIQTVDITYIFYIVGSLCACLLVFMGMTLDTATSLKSTAKAVKSKSKPRSTKKKSKPAADLDDIYIE